jgi:hypothetical protein
MWWEQGHIPLCELVKQGAQFEIPAPLTGLQALAVAVQLESLEVVEILLNNNVDVNGTCQESSVDAFTPLHIAVYHDLPEMTNLLLYYKADPYTVDSRNQCAYSQALEAETYRLDCIKLLIQHGYLPDKEISSGGGWTALHTAASSLTVDHLELFNFLHGVNLDCRTDSGLSPFHLLCLSERMSESISELSHLRKLMPIQFSEEFKNSPQNLEQLYTLLLQEEIDLEPELVLGLFENESISENEETILLELVLSCAVFDCFENSDWKKILPWVCRSKGKHFLAFIIIKILATKVSFICVSVISPQSVLTCAKVDILEEVVNSEFHLKLFELLSTTNFDDPQYLFRKSIGEFFGNLIKSSVDVPAIEILIGAIRGFVLANSTDGDPQKRMGAIFALGKSLSNYEIRNDHESVTVFINAMRTLIYDPFVQETALWALNGMLDNNSRYTSALIDAVLCWQVSEHTPVGAFRVKWIVLSNQNCHFLSHEKPEIIRQKFNLLRSIIKIAPSVRFEILVKTLGLPNSDQSLISLIEFVAEELELAVVGKSRIVILPKETNFY